MIQAIELSEVFQQEMIRTTVLSNTRETELIEACKTGDPKAQFQVYKMYYKKMYLKCLKIVNDPGKAEEIVQESFLAAFEKMGSFSGALSLGLWLEMIVHNRSVDCLRNNCNLFYHDVEHLPGKENRTITSLSSNIEKDNGNNKAIGSIKNLLNGCRSFFSNSCLKVCRKSESDGKLSISASVSR